MKAISFLPAATQMIYDMGLQDELHGVTFECPAVAADKAKIVRYILEGKNYSSVEIDRIFSAAKAEGKSLYYVDDVLLEAISPDIIFTQDVCEVCQIDTACTQNAVVKLAHQPQLISLSPNTLDDVFDCVLTIANAMNREEAAYKHLSQLKNTLDGITDKLRQHNSPLKSVMLMEWIEPVYNCGHWIPYQIARAGGVDMLSNPGGDSIVTSWEKIVRYNPEVLVMAPCGFTVDRTLEEMHLLTQKPEWTGLRAVKSKQVFIADFDLFTQPSAQTLVNGIELLASLFHPDIFDMPQHLQDKYQPFFQQEKVFVRS